MSENEGSALNSDSDECAVGQAELEEDLVDQTLKASQVKNHSLSKSRKNVSPELVMWSESEDEMLRLQRTIIC
jgi:hypothetical protein